MARLLASSLLLLLGLAAQHSAATAAPHLGSLRVEGGFLDAAQASELAARVPPVRGPLEPFSQPVDVPTSLYARSSAPLRPRELLPSPLSRW